MSRPLATAVFSAIPVLVLAAAQLPIADAADAGASAPLLPALHVAGAKILDATGKEVWLQGVNVPSLEWSDTGESMVPEITAATDSWKANVIRLPVSAARWLGTSEGQKDGGVAYRAIVDDCVRTIAAHRAYAILDLHGYRAPHDADVAFWKDAAAHFKDDPAVLFGLLNEPHDTSWEQWRNGGDLTDKVKAKKPGDQDQEVTFHSIGIQGLFDTVRATGAKNIVVAGGLDWAYDLSGVLKGFALVDHGGAGIVYDSHCYAWKTNWDGCFLAVSRQYPVLIGECGCDTKRYDFVPVEHFEEPWTWAPDLLGLVQAHHLHWCAWSFHPSASPSLIQEQKTFMPTPYWGTYVRSALLGEIFTTKRQR